VLVSFVYYYYYYYRVFEFSVDGPSIIIKSQTLFQIKIKKILNIIITTLGEGNSCSFTTSDLFYLFNLITLFNIKFYNFLNIFFIKLF
jgi:hypothetical protein